MMSESVLSQVPDVVLTIQHSTDMNELFQHVRAFATLLVMTILSFTLFRLKVKVQLVKCYGLKATGLVMAVKLAQKSI